jgi:UDP-N-acetylglucosamine--N-acetylmuramyl-(pentapeptide) pyrophosphoryl-undecaprenol N-acetylglucosamine transferase
MKILFTDGGSGGHIFPIIAIAREIRRIFEGKKLQILYIGPKDEFAETFFTQEQIKMKKILAGKIRRYLTPESIFQNFLDIFFRIPIGIWQAFFYIFFKNPDLIFSKGGFGSLPAVLAGRMLGVPIFLHESDITPGLANRFLGKFALEIFVSFPRTETFSLKKMILVGNPIRKEILEGTKEEAKKIFKLKGGRPVILVLGGSQGAQRINDKILEVLPQILTDFELIHQSGEKNLNQVKAEAKAVISTEKENYYHLFPFLKEEELKHAYAAADLILSRAGSGTIFEIAAWGKPSILIPLPEAAQGHQVRNAYAFHQTGAAMVIEESNFTARFCLERIRYLFSHPEELEKMAQAAKEFSRPWAAKVIAGYIIEYLK